MITPQDIQSKQFHVRFRGFDMEEVDVFLERVAEDMLTLIQENKQLREKNEEVQKDMDSFKQQSRTFQDAIITAQKIADEMKIKGVEEARQIVQQAEAEAKKLQEQATREVTMLERQVDDLKALRGQLREELLLLLDKTGSQLDEIFGRDADTPVQRSKREMPPMEQPETETMPVEALGLASILTNEPEPPPSQSVEETEQEPQSSEIPAPDLSDLYTSIHIDSDLMSGGPPPLPPMAAVSGGGQERPAPAVKLNFGHDSAASQDEGPLPDIDGDLSFSLEDPLDIEPERTVSRKKRR